MSESVETVTEPLSGSAMLRQAREQAGVHVAALAVALKVPVRQLEALEQGHLDRLPDHTFARALAGSVCRQLKVDPAPILAALPQGSPRTVTVNVGINEPFRSSSPVGGASWRERAFRPPVIVAVLLLLGALALIVLPELQADETAATAAKPGAAAASPAPVASDKVVIEPVTPNLLPAADATPVASAAAPASNSVASAATRPAVPALPAGSGAKQP